MRDKKGAVELQFNWIYILIAGAIILALATGFVIRWMHTAERGRSAESLRNLETILTSASVVEGGTKLLDTTGIELSYNCKSLRLRGVQIQSLRTAGMFAPTDIKGRKAIIWSDAWFAPFYVGNMLFFTTDNTRYIIVYDKHNNRSLLMRRILFNLIPEQLNIRFIDVTNASTIFDQNNNLVVFAFLDTNPVVFSNVKREKLGVKFTIDDNNETGSVDFLKPTATGWTNSGSSVWIKREMMLGALVSSDFEIYNCVYNNFLDRYEIVSGLLAEKVKVLEANYPNETVYELIEEQLDEIHNDVVSRSFARDVFLDKMKRLEKLNLLLAYKGIPTVY